MNELIKERIKESKGKIVLIFLVNNFRYEGKILNSDDKYIEILDKKGYQIILISEIKQIEVIEFPDNKTCDYFLEEEVDDEEQD